MSSGAERGSTGCRRIHRPGHSHDAALEEAAGDSIQVGDLLDDPRTDAEALCLCSLLWSAAATMAGSPPESAGHYALAVASAAYRRGFHTAAAARTAQTRAEAAQQTAETAQQTAETANMEAQTMVEQLRTELTELRQQHRTELDTLRADNRAERDQLRAEHRDQLADLRTLARTAEQRAEEHRERRERAEALVSGPHIRADAPKDEQVKGGADSSQVAGTTTTRRKRSKE